jgi:homoserine dehydrogenase
VKTVNVILMGYGRVGNSFEQLVQQKETDCADRYGFRLRCVAVFNSKGGLLLPPGAAAEKLFPDGGVGSDIAKSPFWKSGRTLEEALKAHRPGVLLECTSSDIKSGGPALQYIHQAIDKNWHVVTANKGPLVVDFDTLMKKARKNRVSLGMSGATAAALPTLDVALHSLAGTEIWRIDGILNGTTNYILTRMSDGVDYPAALKEAQQKGIAEPDPSQDVEGKDTAAKILIITNVIFRTGFTLDDVQTEGITHIPPKLREEAKKESKSLKLIGSFIRETGVSRLEVKLSLIEPSHPLYGVNGAQKGITFFTDSMDSVTVTGGKSDPKGAAAALLKDIINIHRDTD